MKRIDKELKEKEDGNTGDDRLVGLLWCGEKQGKAIGDYFS